MCSQHQQVRFGGVDLRDDRVMHQPCLPHLVIDRHVPSHATGEFPHLCDQSRTILFLEHQRRSIDRGQADERVKHREPCLVPLCDCGGMRERVVRDVREVDRAQDPLKRSAWCCGHA